MRTIVFCTVSISSPTHIDPPTDVQYCKISKTYEWQEYLLKAAVRKPTVNQPTLMNWT